MFLLFLILFVIDIILFDFMSFFSPILSTDTELYSLSFVLVHGVCVLFYLGVQGGTYKNILIGGFLFRVLLLIVDIYGLYGLLHSGGDSEAFNGIAIYNQTHTEQLFRTNYTVFLTFLYSITHCSRIIAQYLNVLFGMGLLYYVWQILEKLQIDAKVIVFCLLILAFSPNFAMFSSILLREAWIHFFVILSVYFFLDWYLQSNEKAALLALASVFAAAYMHSGTLVVAAGYIVAFLTYNPRTETVQFSRQTIFSLVLLGVAVVFLAGSTSTFASHFTSVESPDALNQAVNYQSDGGSVYLTWLRSDNIWMSLLFAPLKMFYFLFSPIPFNWRGLGDVIAFAIDSSIYLFLCWKIYQTKVTYHSMALLKNFLMVSLMVSTFVFAFGTYTAGTAMRHRAKILPVFFVAYAITATEQYIKKEEEL